MAKCSAVGAVNSPNKTPPQKRRRNERICETSEREATITIPLVVGIVVVRIEPRTIVIAIGIEKVQIAVGIATRYFLCHCPLNTLRAVSYLAS